MYNTSPFVQSSAPKGLRICLIAVGIIALGSALLTQILGHWLDPFTPMGLLSLSIWGVKQMFFWQFLTYPFVAPYPISVGLLFYLAFNLYLFWTVGTQVMERTGRWPLVRCLLLSVLVGGLLSMAALPFTGATISGLTPILFGLLTIWAMHMPDTRLILFIFPVRVKWLVVILLGFSVLTDFGAGDYGQMLAYLGAVMTSYLYGLVAWNLRGPFALSQKFDDALAHIGIVCRRWRRQ